MQFLAGLRENYANEQQQLNYILFEDQDASSLVLSVVLIDKHKQEAGQSLENTVNYRLNLNHLENPPAFITTTDIEIGRQLILLQQLENIDTQQFLMSDDKQLLKQIIATERCVFKTRNKMIAGPGLSDQPALLKLDWQVDTFEGVKLVWKSPQAEYLLSIRGDHQPWIAFNHITSQFYFCEASFNNDDLQWLKECLAGFSWGELHQNENKLSKYSGLSELKIDFISVNAQLEPILFFDTAMINGQKTAFACIKYRYQSDQLCCVLDGVDTSQSAEPIYFCLDSQADQVFYILRDCDLEQHYFHKLKSVLINFDLNKSLPNQASFLWTSSDESNWKSLLLQHLNELNKSGFSFQFGSTFDQHYVSISQWRLSIDDKNQQNFKVNIKVNLGSQSMSVFDLLSEFDQQRDNGSLSKVNGDTLLTLDDGRMLIVPLREFEKIKSELGDSFDSSASDQHCVMSRYQLDRLNSVREKLDFVECSSDQQVWFNKAAKIREEPQLIQLTEKHVKAQLRPYQWAGVCWLQHVKENGLNVILADDMGLGKTLQTLAHLSYEFAEYKIKQPALIVVPTSLIENWQREIKKFTPHLSVQIFYGPKRAKKWAGLQHADIIISTYSLIARDLEQWQNIPLSWLVLDEAQYISNPKTKASQAVRQLSSRHRLCLTGTPVQNHLAELWSLIDFLMPGCLGNLKAFRQYYQKPIENMADQSKMNQLKQRISAYILRRNKQEVADDLPSITEIDKFINLSETQLAGYEAHKFSVNKELQQRMDGVDSEQNTKSFFILTALMKLRQFCCDPALIGESDVGSAKTDFCIDMLGELVEEGRAVLVFSQFTSMLDILAQRLDDEKLSYLKLTGASRKRQDIVDCFQNGEVPILLISLKAGGVGLNLTRADTVIHYDPWWNDAAQRQATDRAHRIGQKNPVFVYKLICNQTIEQKIQRLQQFKAGLSDQLMHEANKASKQFSNNLEQLLDLWNREMGQND